MKKIILEIDERQMTAESVENALMILYRVSSSITVTNIIPTNAPLPRKKHRDPDMTTPEAIMSHYGDHSSKEFTKEQAAAWLADKGFSPSGASPALSRLNQRGYVGLLKRGRYEFLKPLEEGVSI